MEMPPRHDLMICLKWDSFKLTAGFPNTCTPYNTKKVHFQYDSVVKTDDIIMASLLTWTISSPGNRYSAAALPSSTADTNNFVSY